MGLTMSTEKTLSIIKPDATSRNIIGKIISRFEENNLKVSALKLIQLTKEDAAAFYSEHKGKPFFDKLANYMISSPIVVQVLEGENAVKRNRERMGATNPSDAEPGTLRYDFAESIDANAVHGSDSIESAEREINFFFQEKEIF